MAFYILFVLLHYEKIEIWIYQRWQTVISRNPVFAMPLHVLGLPYLRCYFAKS